MFAFSNNGNRLYTHNLFFTNDCFWYYMIMTFRYPIIACYMTHYIRYQAGNNFSFQNTGFSPNLLFVKMCMQNVVNVAQYLVHIKFLVMKTPLQDPQNNTCLLLQAAWVWLGASVSNTPLPPVRCLSPALGGRRLPFITKQHVLSLCIHR